VQVLLVVVPDRFFGMRKGFFAMVGKERKLPHLHELAGCVLRLLLVPSLSTLFGLQAQSFVSRCTQDILRLRDILDRLTRSLRSFQLSLSYRSKYFNSAHDSLSFLSRSLPPAA
ncbi:hypothetical protein Tco_0120204, partial [Tanacetum coccineum]